MCARKRARETERARKTQRQRDRERERVRESWGDRERFLILVLQAREEMSILKRKYKMQAVFSYLS